MSPSKFAVEHPVLTLIIFALLGIMGLFVLNGIPIDLFPDIEIPVAMVFTTYDNAGPESVEKSVTEVLEGSLVSVSDLDTLTSYSMDEVSMIVLEFEYGTDLDVAVSDIRDKIDMVRNYLPDTCDSPSIMKMDASAMPIMRIAVRGNMSGNELREYADETIADLLTQASGVAETRVSGGDEKIVRVEIDKNRLDAFGLTLSTVSSSLASQNLELGGGKITEQTRDYSVRTMGEFSSIEDINNAVVATVNGYDVKLSDIGRAFEGYEDRSNAVYINGQEGVYMSIVKQSGRNTVAVANSVYRQIEEIQGILPAGVTLEIISDDTDEIEETIGILIDSLVQGIILAVGILFLFLKSMKSTMIISISIPLSMIITILAMYLAGITLNLITFTGLILGLGMVVDASVVMIDNIYTYRLRGAKPHVSAILGSSEMFASVFSGNLTTVCVFVPFILFMGDLKMMGQMFKEIIFVIIIALLSSLFVAVFLVPALAGHFLPLTNREEKPVKNKLLAGFYAFLDKILDWTTDLYRIALQTVLRHRIITTVLVTAVFVLSLFMLGRMNFVFMDAGEEDSVDLNVELSVGTTLAETETVMRQLERIAHDEIEGYETIIVSVGTGASRQSGDASYRGGLSIQLPDLANQIDSSEDVKEKLRRHFPDFPGVSFTFEQSNMQSVAGYDIDIAVRSNDLDAAYETSLEIERILNTMTGDLADVDVSMTAGLPQVEILIDRQRAYSFGLTVNAIANEINACIDGVTAAIYRDRGEEYDMVVMLQPSDRSTVLSLEDIYVNSPSGRVSVANFAEVVKGTGPVSITREDQMRIIHVTADIISNTRADIMEDMIQEEIAANMIIPEGVTVSYEGSWEEIQNQVGVFLKIFILAILLVFGVMAGTYESFKAPLINLFTIPMLTIGVAVSYTLMGQALSIMSVMGIVMLVGIVVNNGIILVDYTTLLRERGMSLMDACLAAGVSRLRPVLMTSLTTILGMLPMCFDTDGMAGVVQPIALCVAGGLTSSTFITLLFIPVVYSFIMRKDVGRRSTSRAMENLKQLEAEKHV